MTFEIKHAFALHPFAPLLSKVPLSHQIENTAGVTFRGGGGGQSRATVMEHCHFFCIGMMMIQGFIKDRMLATRKSTSLDPVGICCTFPKDPRVHRHHSFGVVVKTKEGDKATNIPCSPATRTIISHVY